MLQSHHLCNNVVISHNAADFPLYCEASCMAALIKLLGCNEIEKYDEVEK